MSALSGIDIALWDLKGRRYRELEQLYSDAFRSAIECACLPTAWWQSTQQSPSLCLGRVKAPFLRKTVPFLT